MNDGPEKKDEGAVEKKSPPATGDVSEEKRKELERKYNYGGRRENPEPDPKSEKKM